MESSLPQRNTAIPSGNLYLKIITAIAGAHIIVTFGEEITFFQAIINPRYYKAMAGSVLIAALVVQYIGFVNRKLDERYNWLTRPVHRALMQLCIGVGSTGIIAFLLAFLYFRIRGVDILNTLYLRFDFAVIMLLILVMNMVFVLHFFYQQLKQVRLSPVSPAQPAAWPVTAPKKRETFPVNSAGKIIPLPLDQICYFFLEEDYRFLQTFQGQKYVLTKTIEDTELLLDSKQFFRANRQVIVSIGACSHYSVIAFGKLEVFTNPAFDGQIIISQKRAKAFKEWIGR